VSIEPAEDETGTAVVKSQREEEPPQAPQEGDEEAAKKFVSPIRFLNR